MGGQLKNDKRGILMPRQFATKSGRVHKISAFCTGMGDAGRSYYWTDDDKSGNFDVITSTRSLSIFGVRYPTYAKFSIRCPKGHDKPPEDIIKVLKDIWRRQAKRRAA